MQRIITGETWGTVYLLHLSARLGNLRNRRAQAQHYIGWALDLEERLDEHERGIGSKMLAAAVARGITFQVVATWSAPLSFEKYLKSRKQAPRLCPCCCAARDEKPLQVEVQLSLPLGGSFEEVMPEVEISTKMDSYEFLIMRGFNLGRTAPEPALVLADDWDDGFL